MAHAAAIDATARTEVRADRPCPELFMAGTAPWMTQTYRP